MAGDPRTYKVTSPHMQGGAIDDWQRVLNKQMDTWGIDYHIAVDGDYGVVTRDLGRSVAYGLGMSASILDRGVTPELRRKIRNKDLTDAERKRFQSRQRENWRNRLKKKHEGGGVCSPLVKILQHSWGWRPGVHDGVDLICPADAHGYAMCRAKVVRVDDSWWGLGAPADPALRDRGDGIVIVRSLVDVGPIKKGMNFGYGHAEKPRVRDGDVVNAGDWICNAGLANAWHFHFMVNNDDTTRGVGDRDPWPFVKYAITHA